MSRKPDILHFENSQKRSLKGIVTPFDVGDTITIVHIVDVSGRTQSYTGLCIGIKGAGISKSFKIRLTHSKISVEKIFMLYDPNIKSISISYRSNVRRAKLNYIRNFVGKSQKLRRANRTTCRTNRIQKELD